jgi:hypothetical protein
MMTDFDRHREYYKNSNALDDILLGAGCVAGLILAAGLFLIAVAVASAL